MLRLPNDDDDNYDDKDENVDKSDVDLLPLLHGTPDGDEYDAAARCRAARMTKAEDAGDMSVGEVRSGS